MIQSNKLLTGARDDTRRLLARCKRGDQGAWSELVRRFQSLVYSVAMRVHLNEDDAADVFQNTFLALSRNLDRIESPEALPKWLSVTASREALRIKRISGRTRSTTLDDDQSLDELMASEDASAEQLSVQATDAHTVRIAVEKLPDKCRRLLSALFFEEVEGYGEVSERLGIPIGAIGPTRARCLEKLKKALESEDFFG